MARIWVCGLDDLPGVVERVRPARLVSLLPRAEQPPTPLGMAPANHLRLFVDDVEQPAIGRAAPGPEDVLALIRFVRAAPRNVSVVIHCLAGVSRSPAAALVALALDAPGREREAARALRAASPCASPNRLIVELADAALERNGALSAALSEMSEPDFVDLVPFWLPRTL